MVLKKGLPGRAALAVFLSVFIAWFFPGAGAQMAYLRYELFSQGWDYVHHLVQLGLAVFSIMILVWFSKNDSFSSWGFSFRNYKWSIKTAIIFGLGWILISIVVRLTIDTEPGINYPLCFLPVFKDLFFDFIITPISEEILFRGFIFGIVSRILPENKRLLSLKLSPAIILSTVVFALAHTGIDFQQLRITCFNPVQLLFCLGLGGFYAWMRDYSNSLLGPVIAHGITDGSLTVINLVLTAIA